METTEIQPNGYHAINQPMASTIAFAYLPLSHQWTRESEPLNQPHWVHDLYDIDAKVSAADRSEWRKQGAQRELLSAMLRSMLEDRCKIAVHWNTGTTRGYALTVGKKGPHLRKVSPGEAVPSNTMPLRLGMMSVPGAAFRPFSKNDGRTSLPLFNVSMKVLAEWLSQDMETTIVDQTGLTDTYNVVLNLRNREGDPSNSDPLSTWDLDALGLKLVPIRVPTKRLVIDHIERPSAN